ncbi:hypothetical protein ACH5RR_001566 [Cinchona calisaya]|uniref:Uncharacterized protein n=1 Tax=Cinchona calisaya TaxID=153742 RepID=A0ABD3B3R9_9GENT
MLDQQQRQNVDSIKFGALLKLPAIEVDEYSYSWVFDNFNVDDMCLIVHGHSLPIGPIDVEYVFGLTSRGVEVEGQEEELAYVTSLEKMKAEIIGGEMGLAELGRSLKNMQSSGDEFKVKFVLFVIVRVLCPAMNFSISKSLLCAVCNVDKLPSYNWSKYILDNLVNGIRRRRERSARGVGGYVLLLMA